MVKMVILTHGGLAEELLEAATTIVGELPSEFLAIALDWEDSFEVALAKTERALEESGSTNGTLILTDMYGGTPYRVATSLRRPGKIEVVTGVNLPMVVRLGCPGVSEMQLDLLATWIQNKAQSSIRLAGEGNGTDVANSCSDNNDD